MVQDDRLNRAFNADADLAVLRSRTGAEPNFIHLENGMEGVVKYHRHSENMLTGSLYVQADRLMIRRGRRAFRISANTSSWIR